MQDYYSVKEASQLTGASKPVIRTYTQRYARYMSTEATPEQGKERRFTADDLRVLAFVYTYTSAGETHDQVLERLAAGELDSFDWQPAEMPESPQSPVEGAESASTALVPVERLVTAQALLQDAQRREREATERAESLASEVRRLERELGEASGRLAARYRAPRWWRSLFGGSSDS